MSLEISRRQFFRAGAAAAATTAFGFDLKAAAAAARVLKIARTTETKSVCPYCAVGCGVVIHSIPQVGISHHSRPMFSPIVTYRS